ncbi:hypothetical protein [Streptomyces shenzhenensis]|uniref:hypothetical protein n=1 Tax=Streptomyces shenzhenensis TaxID=943815 RepID=UPI0036803730
MAEPNVQPSHEHPRCADAGRLPSYPCLRSAGHGGHHRDALGGEWGATVIRDLGTDPVTGKHAHAVTQPGGVLDYMADLVGLESAATLLAVVSSVLDSEGDISSDEMAVFLRPTADALREVLAIAAKRTGDPRESEAARALGAALRGGRR